MHPLEEYRKENKLKMSEVCDTLGCGLSVYKSWIYGWRYPSVRNLEKIEKAVGVTPDRLFSAYKQLQKNPGEVA
jgi:transcriptional regulator with XRE-family HTH domain